MKFNIGDIFNRLFSKSEDHQSDSYITVNDAALNLVDFATQVTLLAETVQIGDIDSALVAAGAVGSVNAKMRRLTTDIDAGNTQVGATSAVAIVAGAEGSVNAKLRTMTTDLDKVATQIGAISDAAIAAGAAGSVAAKLRLITTELDSILTNIGPVYDPAAITNLSEVVAITNGATINMVGYKRITFHIASVGATDATVVIQSTLDGTNWKNLKTFVLTTATVDESVSSDVSYIGMRSIVSAWVSGTITTKYGRA